MSTWDNIKLTALNALPDGISNRIIINNYINSLKNGKSKGSGVDGFSRAVLNSPGRVSSLYNYLSTEGSDKIQDIVRLNLGDKWYAKPVGELAGLPFIRNITMNKMLDKMLPKIHGTTSLAQQFMAAGGQV